MKKKTLFAMAAFVLAVLFLNSCGNCNENGKTECEKAQQCEKSMSALDCIMTRKSVRSYTDQPVEDEKIEKILRAGMAAPSAVNKQPWKFVVIKNREVLNKLAEANRGTRMAAQAPLAIAVCGDTTKAIEGEGREFWVQDASAATENILLAAHSLGLGAVWTGIYPIKERTTEIGKILELPDYQIVLCVIPIGYPAENPEVKDKWNTDNIKYIN
jgi:nitroreductase